MHFLRAFCRNTSGSESIHPPHSTSSNCCMLMRRFPRGQTWPKLFFGDSEIWQKKHWNIRFPLSNGSLGWKSRPTFAPFKNLGKDQICIGSAEPHEWLSAPKVWCLIPGLGLFRLATQTWKSYSESWCFQDVYKNPMYCVSVAITSFYSYQQTSKQVRYNGLSGVICWLSQQQELPPQNICRRPNI